jgi:hypothetical protein
MLALNDRSNSLIKIAMAPMAAPTKSHTAAATRAGRKYADEGGAKRTVKIKTGGHMTPSMNLRRQKRSEAKRNNIPNKRSGTLLWLLLSDGQDAGASLRFASLRSSLSGAKGRVRRGASPASLTRLSKLSMSSASKTWIGDSS